MKRRATFSPRLPHRQHCVAQLTTHPKRKVSGGTRSDLGRDCRDAFLGLAKTCAKLGITFWNSLGSRLSVPDQPLIPALPELIRCRSQPA
jgi:hypothetical protein